MTVYFAHISDTHIGPTKDFTLYENNPYACTEKLIDTLNSLPKAPDFVIHTGDVVADPHPQAYELAAELFGRLNTPIYFATGNHDASVDMNRYLGMGQRHMISAEPSTNAYRFDVNGERFLVLDGRGPDEMDPNGILSAEQLEWVRSEATASGPPLTVFLHWVVLPMNAPSMDKNMLLINGDDLHQALLPARDKLRGVFHGHIHQSLQIMRDGIAYISCRSAFAQFAAWPGDVKVVKDLAEPAGYNFVHLTESQTIVHQHTYIRPPSG